MIFATIAQWIKKVVKRVFNSKSNVQQEVGADLAVSTEMEKAITDWMSLYRGEAPWLKPDSKRLNLPAYIASEVAKLVTLEMKVEIKGENERVKYLSSQLAPFLEAIRTNVEYGCAGGGIVFKPFIDDIDEKTIAIDVNTADMFYPIAFNQRKEMTGVAFLERKVEGKVYYTRLEVHQYEKNKVIVTNKAFKSENEKDLGTRVPLSTVIEWAHLSEDPVTIENVKKPLFAYFKIPLGNTIDPASPLGMSIYGRAIDLIQDGDEQYQRFIWENEGGELGIHASRDAFQIKNNEPQVPKGKERLFWLNELDPASTSGDDLLKTFSPDLRNEELFYTLNKILIMIEDRCHLSRGTISEITEMQKTATETKQSKQKTYTTISDIQMSLKKAIKDLIDAMDTYATLYNLAPTGKYDVSFYFDDSISQDTETEKMNDRQDVREGLMSKKEYRIKWYGESEEEAEKSLQTIKGENLTDDELMGFGKK